MVETREQREQQQEQQQNHLLIEEPEQQQHQACQQNREQHPPPQAWRVSIPLIKGKRIGLELDFNAKTVKRKGVCVSRVNRGLAMELGVRRGDRLAFIGGIDTRNADVCTIREMIEQPNYPTEIVLDRELQDERDGSKDVGGDEGFGGKAVSTEEGTGSAGHKYVALKRGRKYDEGEEASKEKPPAARKKTLTARAITRGRGTSKPPANQGDNIPSTLTGNRKRGSQSHGSREVEAQAQERHKRKKLQNKKQHRHQEKKKTHKKQEGGQKFLTRNEKQGAKDFAIDASPRNRSQVVTGRQLATAGDGGEDAEQNKRSAPLSSAASIPHWLGQLISLEVSGMTGTNAARATLVMRKVRDMLAKELKTLQRAGKVSEHVTRAEYVAFRGPVLDSSPHYLTLKELSWQYLSDHDNELAEIARDDIISDLLGDVSPKEELPPTDEEDSPLRVPLEDGEQLCDFSRDSVGSLPGLEILKKMAPRVKFVLESHEMVQDVVRRALACHEQALATEKSHRMIRRQCLLDMKETRSKNKDAEKKAETVIAKVVGWQKAALVGENVAVEISGFVTQRAEMLRDAVEFLMSGIEMQKSVIERLGSFHLLDLEAAKLREDTSVLRVERRSNKRNYARRVVR